MSRNNDIYNQPVYYVSLSFQMTFAVYLNIIHVNLTPTFVGAFNIHQTCCLANLLFCIEAYLTQCAVALLVIVDVHE